MHRLTIGWEPRHELTIGWDSEHGLPVMLIDRDFDFPTGEALTLDIPIPVFGALILALSFGALFGLGTTRHHREP